jgi:DNA-binding GntR family transcriptional regulator
MISSRRDAPSVVVTALTELILTGKLPAGDQVIESEIAERLGVSRTPVREAIAQLVGRGLLIKENNRSARVRRPSLDDLIEIYEMRILLECHTSRCAAQEATSEHICELREIEARLRTDNEADEQWFDDHSSFHRMIAATANRPRFVHLIEDLQHQSEPYVRMVTRLDAVQFDRVRVEHRDLTKAIAAGDADRAEELTRQHLNRTVNRMIRIFEATDRFIPRADRSRERSKGNQR